MHSWVGQLPYIVTGIAGIGYYLIIVHTILYGVAALIFEGRRWRIFFMTAIIAVLTLPLYMGGQPYDIIARLPMLTSAFFFDLIFNSIYKMFKTRHWLLFWAISGVTFHFTLTILLKVPINLIFYTPDVVGALFQATIVFLPVIIIEAIIGGYIGYQIYKKVEHIV
jgi:hypothetical protein